MTDTVPVAPALTVRHGSGFTTEIKITPDFDSDAAKCNSIQFSPVQSSSVCLSPDPFVLQASALPFSRVCHRHSFRTPSHSFTEFSFRDRLFSFPPEDACTKYSSLLPNCTTVRLPPFYLQKYPPSTCDSRPSSLLLSRQRLSQYRLEESWGSPWETPTLMGLARRRTTSRPILMRSKEIPERRLFGPTRPPTSTATHAIHRPRSWLPPKRQR